MRIGLTGPIHVHGLRPWLDLTTADLVDLPQGMVSGGTPLTQLTRGLLERGHHVTVVSLDQALRTTRVHTGPRLRLVLEPDRTARRTRDAFRQERTRVCRALRREAPDVVHAHWTYEYALGALDSGLPTLITVRDWAPTIVRLRPTLNKVVKLGMNVAALHRGEHFTVTSPYMQRLMRRWVRGSTSLIPNAIGDDLFVGPRPPRDGSDLQLLAVGSGFSRRKNTTTLLEAFTLVRRELPSCTLRLVGQHHEVDGPAHRWAAGRGLDVGVEFLGIQPNPRVHELITTADVLVHPALEESFGLVLVEAMARGTPVIGGADSGAVPWVLDHGRAGVLVDVRSAERLSTGIVDLLRDPARRDHLSKVGFDHAHANFRVGRVVDRYVALYEALYEQVHATA